MTGKIWYSWDFGDPSDSGQYYQLDANIPLPANFSIGLHGVTATAPYWGSDNYFDWSAGVSYTLSHFTLNLKWVDGSDFKPVNDTPDDVFSRTRARSSPCPPRSRGEGMIATRNSAALAARRPVPARRPGVFGFRALRAAPSAQLARTARRCATAR